MFKWTIEFEKDIYEQVDQVDNTFPFNLIK